MGVITDASAIYIDPVNGNLHWAVEANFPGGGWGLQIESIENSFPVFNSLHFDVGVYILFNRDKSGGLWRGPKESAGTMLIIHIIGGFEIRRHPFQSKGVMTPVPIPPFKYEFAVPVNTVKMELQYQGEVGCNFEMHMTAVIS